jgi:hypothetical protein
MGGGARAGILALDIGGELVDVLNEAPIGGPGNETEVNLKNNRF